MTNKNLKRYDNIPLSEKTLKGMTLNIDDLSAIGRLLSLQDNVYDEQFEMLAKKIDEQNKIIREVQTTLKEIQKLIVQIQSELMDHERRIRILETKVGGLFASLDKQA